MVTVINNYQHIFDDWSLLLVRQEQNGKQISSQERKILIDRCDDAIYNGVNKYEPIGFLKRLLTSYFEKHPIQV